MPTEETMEEITMPAGSESQNSPSARPIHRVKIKKVDDFTHHIQFAFQMVDLLPDLVQIVVGHGIPLDQPAGFLNE
jgi:hypothetical protein